MAQTPQATEENINLLTIYNFDQLSDEKVWQLAPVLYTSPGLYIIFQYNWCS